MKFENREAAAGILAKKLLSYKGTDSLIVAIPRGGVPVGYIIAKALGLTLDIFLVKKIGHPLNSEYAVGAVSLEGVSIDREQATLDPDYIRQESMRLQGELKRRYALFTGQKTLPDYNGKTVILVDDGIATGSTMTMAARCIRSAGASRIIIAVPVAPLSAAHHFKPLCDEYICLYEPFDFRGVGQFYEMFPQVEDEEVIRLLRQSTDDNRFF